MLNIRAGFPLVFALIQATGWCAGVWLPVFIVPEARDDGLFPIVIVGLVIGVAEWLTLRRVTSVAPHWIAGYGCAWSVAWWLSLKYGDIFTPGGAMIGIRSRPLRRYTAKAARSTHLRFRLHGRGGGSATSALNAILTTQPPSVLRRR